MSSRADAPPTTTPVPTTRWASATAIFGLVSLAVVVVAWEGDQDRWDLTLLILGTLAVLWLTHAYAHFVTAGPGGSWRDALGSELPIVAGGIPVLAAAVLGALVRWDEETMSVVALTVCGVTLLAMQIAAVRPSGASRRHLVTTVAYDLVAGAVVVFLHVLID